MDVKALLMILFVVLLVIGVFNVFYMNRIYRKLKIDVEQEIGIEGNNIFPLKTYTKTVGLYGGNSPILCFVIYNRVKKNPNLSRDVKRKASHLALAGLFPIVFSMFILLCIYLYLLNPTAL